VAVSGLRTTRFDINAEGRVIVERVKRGVDLQLAVEKTLRLLPEGQFRSADGTDLAFSAQSVCVHGDSPNGPKVVQAIRDALDAAGLQVTVPSAADGVPAADPRVQAGT
jgi:lactam utilization protein B